MKKSFLATVIVLFSTILAVSAQNGQEAPRKTMGEPQNTVNIKPIFAGGETYLKASAFVVQTATTTQPADKQAATEPKPTSALKQ